MIAIHRQTQNLNDKKSKPALSQNWKKRNFIHLVKRNKGGNWKWVRSIVQISRKTNFPSTGDTVYANKLCAKQVVSFVTTHLVKRFFKDEFGSRGANDEDRLTGEQREDDSTRRDPNQRLTHSDQLVRLFTCSRTQPSTVTCQKLTSKFPLLEIIALSSGVSHFLRVKSLRTPSTIRHVRRKTQQATPKQCNGS